MATILVVSDNHFQDKELLNIVNTHPKMDYYVHCGDSQWLPDDERLQLFVTVRGNNDVPQFANEQILTIGSKKVFITHGHQQYVMNYGENNLRGTEELVTYAKYECQPDIILYGHTHVPEFHLDRDIAVLNPGSTNFPRGLINRQPSYAIITIADEQIIPQFYNAQSHQEITELIIK